MWGLDQHQAGTSPSPRPPAAFCWCHPGRSVPAVPPGRLQPHCDQELCPDSGWRKGMLLERARRAFKGCGGVPAPATEGISLGSSSLEFGLHQQPRGSAQHLLVLGWADPTGIPLSLLQSQLSEGRWDSSLGGVGLLEKPGWSRAVALPVPAALGKAAACPGMMKDSPAAMQAR